MFVPGVRTPQRRRIAAAHERRYEDVLDLQTGFSIALSDYLGDGDYGSVIEQKRVAMEMELVEGKARYVCAFCREPMALRSNAIQDKTEERFYFKHRFDSGKCSGKNGLSPAAICARKFANCKEGFEHKQFKRWIEDSIGADPRFSETRIEARWKDIGGVKWRQPDVQTTWSGQCVAFEVQLSTTFLHVLAERMTFYRHNDGRLLWVFRDLDPEAFKLVEDDIFFSNNRNAFKLSAATVALSQSRQRFALECAWLEPRMEANGAVVDMLQHRVVYFDELVFDVSPTGVPRAYFFDYDGALAVLYRQRERKYLAAVATRDQALRDEMETFVVNFNRAEDGGSAWQDLQRRFAQRGIALPTRLYSKNGPFYLLQAAYSAKRGEPVACGLKNLMALAQNTFALHKDTLWVMSVMFGHFDRARDLRARGNVKRWRDNVAKYRRGWLDGDPQYEPNRSYDDLLAFLFPAVADALRRSPSQVEALRRAGFQSEQ